jgi:uncharacterized protein (TIGR03083 family)
LLFSDVLDCWDVWVENRRVRKELDLNATQVALVAATRRTSDLLREARDGRRAVPNLAWTVGETAAHLVTILQHSRGFVIGEEDAMRYATLDPDAGTFAERSVAANSLMLEEFTERDPLRLAELLTASVEEFVAVGDRRRPDERVLIEAGLSMTVPAMTAVLLGEELVHGLDIARALGQPWSIARRDAILVLSASMTMVPEIIDRQGTAGVHASVELRLRGGPRYRVRIDDGTAILTDNEGSVDCWINADPVAALLLGYGRIQQWGQILRGRLIVGGSKPWLVVRFGNLLTPV